MKKLICLLCVLTIVMEVEAQKYNLIVGTYTSKGNSEGIYVYDYNLQTAATNLKGATKSTNPSYLALSPDQQFLYAVNETGDKSATSAFRFNKKPGTLSALNTMPSAGADPCFLAVSNEHVILANYSGGSIAVFSRKKDGSLSNIKQLVEHKGKSIDPERQKSAHVHQVQFSPDKQYLICNDLGEDLVYVYKYNPLSSDQVLTEKSVFKTTPGTGPRHLAFTPNGKFAYLTHEFTGRVTALRYNKGTFSNFQEMATAPAGFSGKIDGADIHVSTDGKFLYQSNRGDLNAITVFSISASGKLNFIERVSTLGRGPRNFAIDPSGNFLLVGHQQSDEIVIFERNKTTGRLKFSGKKIDVGAPVCLIFSKAD